MSADGERRREERAKRSGRAGALGAMHVHTGVAQVYSDSVCPTINLRALTCNGYRGVTRQLAMRRPVCEYLCGSMCDRAADRPGRDDEPWPQSRPRSRCQAPPGSTTTGLHAGSRLPVGPLQGPAQAQHALRSSRRTGRL